jgi:outer membrane protein assembly factor BamA
VCRVRRCRRHRRAGLGRRALRDPGHPRRGPAAHRPGHRLRALPFRIGDTYTDEKGAAALRALFATGLFSDVRIEIEGRTAVVIVDERPIIAKVDFVGLKEFDKEC